MATFPNRPIPGSGWFRGLPPVGEFVAIAVRKWTGKHEGRPVEVIAGSPVMYLKALGLDLILSPSVTVLYGSIHMQGDIPMLMDERGSPVAVYPDCYLAWSKVPDVLMDLQAAVVTDMALNAAKSRKRAQPK